MVQHDGLKPHGYQKGQSGNPGGKPKGTLNHATRLKYLIIEGSRDEIVKAIIEKAIQGYPTAMRICAELLIPVRKGCPVQFTLPPIKSAADVPIALEALTRQMASGELSPDEATAIGGVIELVRRSIETEQLEQRIAALESSAAK